MPENPKPAAPSDYVDIKLISFCLSYKGLSGFFPLHPMTITEAERRRAKALGTDVATGTEDGRQEGQMKTEG